jgi:hypothetical protein
MVTFNVNKSIKAIGVEIPRREKARLKVIVFFPIRLFDLANGHHVYKREPILLIYG